jgi:hypothetical protein
LPSKLDLREVGITGLPESLWVRIFAVEEKIATRRSGENDERYSSSVKGAFCRVK